MSTVISPRLAIVHRPETEHALIIRRGPSKQTAFFGWNRKTNKVELGQWVKAKVYPMRTDICPKGKHVIYFALNGRWQSESNGSFTAVSRYPYLKALDFWPKGDAWNGGGLFLSKKKYLLNIRFSLDKPRLSGRFEVVQGMPKSPIRSGEDPGIYFPKLLRDGWAYQGAVPENEQHTIHRFTKTVDRKVTITLLFHATRNPPLGKGLYFNTYELEGIKDTTQDWSQVENLDVYRRKLFWTQEGKLFTAKLKNAVLSKPELVHDFNGYSFEEVIAPY